MVFNFDLNVADVPVEETCTDTEACVAEKEFTKVLRAVEEEEFCRIVESQFTPFIGHEFIDLEEVVQFYKMYALACGFDVRRYTTKKLHPDWLGLHSLYNIKYELTVTSGNACLIPVLDWVIPAISMKS
ncbi:hypothetical protein RND81_07G172500 [Saponaria officinalis]|uniref:Uncharacterized protein n=1 Tax=Saponaria officinalis TaxID=3572 RepID=A0AAW1JUY0_SAPOF